MRSSWVTLALSPVTIWDVACDPSPLGGRVYGGFVPRQPSPSESLRNVRGRRSRVASVEGAGGVHVGRGCPHRAARAGARNVDSPGVFILPCAQCSQEWLLRGERVTFSRSFWFPSVMDTGQVEPRRGGALLFVPFVSTQEPPGAIRDSGVSSLVTPVSLPLPFPHTPHADSLAPARVAQGALTVQLLGRAGWVMGSTSAPERSVGCWRQLVVEAAWWLGQQGRNLNPDLVPASVLLPQVSEVSLGWAP